MGLVALVSVRGCTNPPFAMAAIKPAISNGVTFNDDCPIARPSVSPGYHRGPTSPGRDGAGNAPPVSPGRSSPVGSPMPSRCDLHVHSKHSDRPAEWYLDRIGAPESYTEPVEIARLAKARGMSFVTIADHDKKRVTCPKCKGKKVEQQFGSFFAVTSKKS